MASLYWGSPGFDFMVRSLNVFINDLEAELKSILSKFVYDTKLGEAVGSLECRETLQGDFDRLEGWAITGHMKFSPGNWSWLQI